MVKRFDLYLDESGDFNDTRANKPYPEDLSLVGGMLVDPKVVTKERLREIYPHKVHCSERGFDSKYIADIEMLKNEGHRIIIFENTEMLNIINPDKTYLNIISEGLVKLFRDLSTEYPEGTEVNVVIAQRNAEMKEYTQRLTEKIIIGLGREKIEGCRYNLILGNAKTDRRLFIADVICYMYLTSHRRENKFTDEQQGRIEELFADCTHYSVFESATVAYVKQLLTDSHYGEAICQICALPHLKTLSKQRDILIRRLLKESRMERDIHFRQMSAMLTLSREKEDTYEQGIALGNHYQQYFLDQLAKYDEIRDEVNYWQFDTDFHMLTIYDHQGNLMMTEVYLDRCRKNADSIIQNWENINYYFDFRIRELNISMNIFQFEDILKRSEEFIKLFSDTSQFFKRINEQIGNKAEIRSTSLGKAQGIRLQAMINLIRREPELYEEAVKASDNAIKEFKLPADKIRQWCYRSLLMVEAEKVEEALQCMMEIAGIIDKEKKDFETVVNYIYREGRLTEIYLLEYYTYVLALLKEKEHPQATEMARVLFENELFTKDWKDTDRAGFPWNVILWNIARYSRMNKRHQDADLFYRMAITASTKNREQITVVSFAVAIAAEHCLNSSNRSAADRDRFLKEWRENNRILNICGLPKSMKEWFGMNHPDIRKQAQSAYK